MRSWSKQLGVLIGSCVLLGCATSDGGDAGAASTQGAGMKMAAASCMSQVDTERTQCEQKCPTATGEEHFSVQHKIAMESSACKERCEESSEQRAMTCKANR